MYENECKKTIISILYIFIKTFERFKKYNKNRTEYDIRFQSYFNYLHNYIKKYHYKNITTEESNNIIYLLLNNYKNIKKIIKIIDTHKQQGGFIYNKYDSIYTKILNMVDVIMSWASTLIGSNILQPYFIVSTFMNLTRKEYMLAFYSVISMISYLGMLIGSSLKTIHYFYNYIMTYRNTQKELIKNNEREMMIELNKILVNYNPSKIYVQSEPLESAINETLLIK